MRHQLSILFHCLAIAGLFGVSLPARAQTAVAPLPVATASGDQDRPATLPVEIAMIYAKLLNTNPDFNALATASPRIENAPEFGRDALIAQERSALENVFRTVKRNSLITIMQNLEIDTIAPSLQTIQFKHLDADAPFTFDVANMVYGVFVRNATSLVMPLQPPFRGGDWPALQTLSLNKQQPLVEITLQPLGADSQDFTTYENQIVKPIIADLIEVKVYDPNNPTRLLLHKRDEKAFANASSELENLLQDDLKDDAMSLAPAVPVTP